MKVDLYRTHAAEYRAPRSPTWVDVRSATYLAAEGRGPPGGREFQAKLRGLYGVAYTTRMAFRSDGKDFRVCGLEGLWGERRRAGRSPAARVPARWRLLIRVPEFVSPSAVRSSVRALERRGRFPPEAGPVRLVRWAEGRCVQMLHIGPYAAERADFERMRAFAAENGYVVRGPHHEIYRSDPRRVPASRLRTILRIGVRARRSRASPRDREGGRARPGGGSGTGSSRRAPGTAT